VSSPPRLAILRRPRLRRPLIHSSLGADQKSSARPESLSEPCSAALPQRVQTRRSTSESAAGSSNLCPDGRARLLDGDLAFR